MIITLIYMITCLVLLLVLIANICLFYFGFKLVINLIINSLNFIINLIKRGISLLPTHFIKEYKTNERKIYLQITFLLLFCIPFRFFCKFCFGELDCLILYPLIGMAITYIILRCHDELLDRESSKTSYVISIVFSLFISSLLVWCTLNEYSIVLFAIDAFIVLFIKFFDLKGNFFDLLLGFLKTNLNYRDFICYMNEAGNFYYLIPGVPVNMHSWVANGAYTNLVLSLIMAPDSMSHQPYASLLASRLQPNGLDLNARGERNISESDRIYLNVMCKRFHGDSYNPNRHYPNTADMRRYLKTIR